MVVLAFEELLLHAVELISGQHAEIMAASSEIRLVFCEILRVDREVSCAADICESVGGTLRAELAVEGVVA